MDRWIARWTAGIQKSIVMTMATGRDFDTVYKLYAKYPDRFEVWCGLDYTGYDQPGFGPAAVKELERCHKAVDRGVGELGDKGKGLHYCKPAAWGMHLDDRRMDPLLEKCAELKMPVNIHVADPYWMYLPMDADNDGLMNAYTWRLDNQPGIVGHRGMIEILERCRRPAPEHHLHRVSLRQLLLRPRSARPVAGQVPELVCRHSARYAETAAIPRFAGQFYEKYQDRLLYGTDMGYRVEMYRFTFRVLESADEHFYAWDYSGYHWPLYGLALGDAVLGKVYRANALKLLRETR